MITLRIKVFKSQTFLLIILKGTVDYIQTLYNLYIELCGFSTICNYIHSSHNIVLLLHFLIFNFFNSLFYFKKKTVIQLLRLEIDFFFFFLISQSKPLRATTHNAIHQLTLSQSEICSHINSKRAVVDSYTAQGPK